MSGSGRFNAMTGMRVERSRFRLPAGMVAQDRRCKTNLGDCCQPPVFYPGSETCFPMAAIPGVVWATFNTALTSGTGLGRALAKAYPLCHSPFPWFLNPAPLAGLSVSPDGRSVGSVQVSTQGAYFVSVAPIEVYERPWDHLEYWSRSCVWWGVFGVGGEGEMRARWGRYFARFRAGEGRQWSEIALGASSRDMWWFVNDEAQQPFDPETGEPILVITWDGVPTGGAPGQPAMGWGQDSSGRWRFYYGGIECFASNYFDGSTPPYGGGPPPGHPPAVCLEAYYQSQCSGMRAAAQLRFPNSANTDQIHPWTPYEELPFSRAYGGGYWMTAGVGLPTESFVEEPDFFARASVGTGVEAAYGNIYAYLPATSMAVSGVAPSAPTGEWGRDMAGLAFPGRLRLVVEEVYLEYVVGLSIYPYTYAGNSPQIARLDTWVGPPRFAQSGPYTFAIRRSNYPKPPLKIELTMERLHGAVGWTGEAACNWGVPVRATFEADRPYRGFINECRPPVRLSLSMGAPVYIIQLAYACNDGYDLCPVTALRGLERDFYAYMAYESSFETQAILWSSPYPSPFRTVQTITDGFFWKVNPPDPVLVYDDKPNPVTNKPFPLYYDGLEKFPSVQVMVDGTPSTILDPDTGITSPFGIHALTVPVRFQVG